MAVSLKEMHRWNPEKITAPDLADAFQRAELFSGVSSADTLFAEGLLQKFRGLLLASMGETSMTKEHFEWTIQSSGRALPAEARKWRIRCAQVMLWLEKPSEVTA